MRTDKLVPALAAVAALALPFATRASEGGASLPHAGNDIRDRASLQRGARNFMNYCSGCHSAQFVRYNRMAADLGITDAELAANLMFTTERSSQTMTARSMRRTAASGLAMHRRTCR